MRKKRILVVDDERSLTQFVKKVLEQTGAYDVCTETDAACAMETAKAFKPDLVFIDVTMPYIEGGDVAARFKADNDLKGVPIIFLTGVVSKGEVRARGGIIGGRPFLAKPIKPNELVAAIERYLAPRTLEGDR